MITRFILRLLLAILISIPLSYTSMTEWSDLWIGTPLIVSMVAFLVVLMFEFTWECPIEIQNKDTITEIEYCLEQARQNTMLSTVSCIVLSILALAIGFKTFTFVYPCIGFMTCIFTARNIDKFDIYLKAKIEKELL